MKENKNKWGDSYQKSTECVCGNRVPDLMFFGGYKKPGTKQTGIYCHCKRCGCEIYYETPTKRDKPKEIVGTDLLNTIKQEKTKECNMDTRNGSMILDEEMQKILKEKPNQAKWFKQVPEEYISAMGGMNRKQRRAFYKDNKKKFKKLEKSKEDNV